LRTKLACQEGPGWGAATRPLCPDPTTTISLLSMVAPYEVFAIRYAHLERTARHNFLGGDEHDWPMPLDYYVWAVINPERTVLVDTGFDEDAARRRGRQIVRPVGEGLGA